MLLTARRAEQHGLPGHEGRRNNDRSSADAGVRVKHGGWGTRCLVERKQRLEAGSAAGLQLGLAGRGDRAAATARAGQG